MASKKIPGMTPDTIIKQMQEAARGKKVRRVRVPDQEEGPVLSGAREAGPDTTGKAGIFGALERPGSGSPEIPDTQGDTGSEASFRVQLSGVLKRMLGEVPPTTVLREMGLKSTTNAELLAEVIQREAFAGKQWACEFWRDMAEGKPVRAAQQNNSEGEIESNLDRVSLAALNRLTESKGP